MDKENKSVQLEEAKNLVPSPKPDTKEFLRFQTTKVTKSFHIMKLYNVIKNKRH